MLARASLQKESATKGPAPASSKSTQRAEPTPAEASRDEFTPAKFAWDLGSMALSAPGCGERPGDDGHSRSFSKALFRPIQFRPMQAKLEVGAVDDPLEREADRVAEQVMRMPGPAAAAGSSSEAPHPGWSARGVQRKCGCGGTCAKCQTGHQDDKHSHVQPEPAAAQISSLGSSPANTAMTTPPMVEEVLRSPGQPLDAGTRAFLEPHFGEELVRVRLHADTLAARSAQEVNARAYTVGNHIVFGPGEYLPGTQEGRRLLAHEMTHAVQQSSHHVGLQRQPAKDPAADRAAAVAEAEDALTCSIKQLELQSDDEERLKLDSKKRNDRQYALAHGFRDQASVKKYGLSVKLAEDISAKIRFFEGAAKAAYLRSIEGPVSDHPDEAQGILAPCAPTGEEKTGGPPEAEISCDIGKNQYVLQYEDEPEKTRCMQYPSDPEFKDLFDRSIASAAAYAVPATTWDNVAYDSFKMLAVKYRNGAGEYFLLDELGNFHYGATTLSLREFTYFKRKKTGVIYPIIDGRVYFNEQLTPKIIGYKNGLTYQVKQLQDLYQLLQTAGAFAQIIALNAMNEDFKISIQGLNRSRFSGFKSVRTRGGGGAGTGGVPPTTGVPDPVDDEITARIGNNERMGQQVGDITITGQRRLNGDTYEIEIGGLFGESGRSGAGDSRKTTDVSGIKKVVSTLIAEARASGARQLRVEGYAIVDQNIMRDGRVKIQGIVRSLGGTVRATSSNSLEILIPLK